MNDQPKTPDSKPPAGAPSSPGPAGQSKQSQLAVRFDNAEVRFANFTVVTGTPEEVIVDFAVAINPQQANVSTRMGMTYATARRLVAALNETLKRHDQMAEQARARRPASTS